MGAIHPIHLKLPEMAGGWLEHAPSPMATVEGPTHLVRDTNFAFCRLIGSAPGDIIGKSLCALLPDNPECLGLLDEVYRTGKAGTLQDQEHDEPGPVFSSYVMWPVAVDGLTSGVVIQVTETAPLHARMTEMNEALVLGSLRQHELTASVEAVNIQLQAEIVQRVQSESDAQMLASEISHRIKNNLQVVASLIRKEIKRTPAEFASGYVEMEARIIGIAKLYELISQSKHAGTVRLDAYLKNLAKVMSGSLLEPSSQIRIEVKLAALEIDADRAVPFGLLVNELGTNAIKHAFPDGIGQITFSIAQDDAQIELLIADNGVGMAPKEGSTDSGQHGSNYVAIFVRQLGGTMAVSTSAQTGTVIRILFPLVANPIQA